MLIALVTGGTRGIGRAITEELVSQGYKVFVIFSKNKELAAGMENIFGDSVLVRNVDVSKKDEVDRLFLEIINTFNRLDVLINNAGIAIDGTFHKMDPKDWHKVVDVNLHGAFYCCSNAIPIMRKQNYGRIINISSIVGQKGNFGQTNYAASKAGILGLTKALALENAAKGITVNAVCPGFIETDMVSVIPSEIRKKIECEIPMKRFGMPKEVAMAVMFLVSKNADYITGQELNINGGLLTH